MEFISLTSDIAEKLSIMIRSGIMMDRDIELALHYVGKLKEAAQSKDSTATDHNKQSVPVINPSQKEMVDADKLQFGR